MRVALCSTVVPFVDGGARQIVEWLEEQLIDRGHEVERVYLPQSDSPTTVYRQMLSYRWIDLSHADRVICFRPQSHMIRHPHKVLWFIHHLRLFYDMWDSPYRDFEADAKHLALRDAIRSADNLGLAEASGIFTNSQTVSNRLEEFNGVASEVLYPPIHRPERFSSGPASDEVVYVSRIELHKRQHLLVEAMRYTTTEVRIRLAGTSSNSAYSQRIRDLISENDLSERVSFDEGWITEEDKAASLAGCLASVYMPVDEDSYGYPTLEAAHSSKPTLTTTDSGGVLEFVQDGVNGLCVQPDPRIVARALDRLHSDRIATSKMGERARLRIDELGISWDRVVDRLLA